MSTIARRLSYSAGMRRPVSNRISCIVVMLSCMVVSLAGVRHTSLDWSPPEIIAQSDGTVAVYNMALIADEAGQLHLFYPHRPDESLTFGVDYVLWDGTGWRPPVNVMVNDDGSGVTHIKAAIDAQQRIHLIWGGGFNRLRYAQAPAAGAGTPQGWSRPQIIAEAVTQAGIAVGPDGKLFVAYADAGTQGRLSMVFSADEGTSWSAPHVVALSTSGTAPGRVDLAVDDGGRLHVTWTGHTLPDGDPLTGVFYSRSLDGGSTWEEPLQVDGERNGEIGVGAAGENRVHLVWRSNIGGDGTFHQWSPDGGQTWSAPDREDDRGGISGMPSFAVDSVGAIHYTIGPAKVAAWRDGRLSDYVDVAGEALRGRVQEEPRGTSPERAVLAITKGNHLHVVFETGFNTLWHTARVLELPALPAPPLPTVASAAPAPTEESIDSYGPAPISPTALPSLPDSSPAQASAIARVLAAAAAALALAFVTLVWSAGRRDR